MVEQTFQPAPKLGLCDLNQNIIDAEYAIRGAIPTRAEELEFQLSTTTDGDLPFNNVVYASIGNPQQLDQKPLTFTRQVISILQYPELIKSKDVLIANGLYKKDAFDRACKLLTQIGKSVGAYTCTQGVYGIRETVANSIFRRDGFPADPNDIFLTDGASKAATYLLSILCKDKSTGILGNY